ncbi:DUF5011 domain-containing protein [Listeria weihenstephanensis]|uniref:DUF5011 domain-containing protein n=1 Tax=Listeria weihenstephanensis TaxID=1006155 RepID=A0A841Z2V3_9LIST|nr:immunoglobulin-like domain-containing protein [Listeria weihenstephanensis]MBC1499032.1 DUF5011 domain-containing protein [Listeria weihenstephanensis]
MLKIIASAIMSMVLVVSSLLPVVTQGVMASTTEIQYEQSNNAEVGTNYFIHIYPFKISTTQSILGVVNADVNQIAIEINGVELETRVWPKNGAFSYYAKKLINDSTDEVYMKAYKRNGELLERKKVNLQAAKGSLNVHNQIWHYDTGGALLVEKEGDVVSFRIRVNGEYRSQYGNLFFKKKPMLDYFFRGILMEMRTNGSWSGRGQDIQVELVGFDDNVKEITTTPITIIGEGESSWQKTPDSKGVVTTKLATPEYSLEQKLAGDIPVNAANFPDEKFRNYILSEITFGETTLGQENIDKITDLDIRNLGITNLKGIEYFTELQSLDCSYNKISELDLSKNTKLISINCNNNELSKLNVTNNKLLVQLNCYSNNLSSLNVRNNTELTYLYCYNNNLTELDISKNLNLIDLYCQENQLVSLNVSNNIVLEELWCFDNKLSSLNVRNNVNLKDLYCKNNQLTELDITKNTALKHITFYENSIPQIDITSNPVLSEIACSPQYLTSTISKVAANKWELDIRALSNTRIVQMISENWQFNQTTGLATYTGVIPPKSVLVRYNIREKGVSGATVDFPMMSVVSLVNDGADNAKPVIAASDKTIKVGDKFDPLANVSATDLEDGDLTAKIIVDSKVDTTKAGSYDVIYTVTDKNGNTTTKKITVNVESSTLTTSAFTIGTDNYVKGTYTGDVAKIALELNGVVLQQINVTNSSYQYYANGKIKSASDIAYMVSYGANGKELKRVKIIVVQKSTGQFVVNPFYFGKDSYVTGTYQGDIVKVEVQVNGISQQRINAVDGVIKYYAKNIVTKPTDSVILIGYNSDGLVTDTKVVPVSLIVGTVTATPFVLDIDSYVTGTYTGDIAKVGLTVNGVKGSIIPVPTGSDWIYYAKNLIKNATDVVILTGYDSSGNELSRSTVTVNKVMTKGTVTPNVFKIGRDSYVEGTYTGDVARVELEVNGVKQSRIPATGNVIKYYAKPVISSTSDKVKINAYDATGNLLDSKSIMITNSTGTVKVTPIKTSDSYLYGTASGDVTKIVLSVNGILTASPGIVQTDGTFKYYIKTLNLKISDNVKVIGLDGRGVEVTTENVTITE